ncbi:hypothetical protein C343_06813 [Cryptococcus neoformans C23]|uniref:Uncharacterized protein n=1 Tax=Cryptococcus neoformans (strain H99 / ATCC 208821 / CBS 10515 / FGSC 9487) TaxID=235443 RepID=J9VX36_CRYN9|nr:hypothetical protein CNAG_07875 [Cryptococcus neoformans var. grubii H99]AFR98823.2 hypothetical protein CNAG_07875 [Cryptococcus neoformans var. grubii H99]AUB29025.1 hypothetical protein CKF44_07875 [Cryptococcus neoformans var. grubii]OWZ38394.1 hypothetical protein C343_06813 [Cryptococcus neoformans var. grubii C23]|eukprot:XP_012053590.1 hypothetical protein CNAG_07875 [Cryptococcus neoformans var. grubii H99]
MSSCAATSRVIYFLLFHNPFHNHNVHTSRTHISLAISHCLLTWPSPACTTPVPICTHLHTCTHLHPTQPLLRSDFPSPYPNPRDDLRPRPRRPRKRPRHRRHGIHRSLPLCRCQRQANGGVV